MLKRHRIDGATETGSAIYWSVTEIAELVIAVSNLMILPAKLFWTHFCTHQVLGTLFLPAV